VKTYEQFLRESAVPRETIDAFLDPETQTWAQFDPEVGYILYNYMPRDGIDGSSTISTVEANGARKSAVYADRPCRINTYGNSFTQCHQVNDPETWQEYLAGHLGEPIRNFGMGGFGVYQAFRRMLRTEETADGAEYVILYIWGDDHMRSCMRCRYVITRPWIWHQGPSMFHGNFWAHVEMDLETGRLVERESLLPTPESLYRMADPDFMAEAMGDDLMSQMYVMLEQHTDHEPMEGFQLDRLNRLAEILGCDPLTSRNPEEWQKGVRSLRNAYGFAATTYILDRAAEYAASKGKKLLVALYCPMATRELIEQGTRYDQPVVEHLKNRGSLYFDMNVVHLEDFRCFNLSREDYMARYSIGHYSPAGNHFFAYSIKDTIVAWLEPKPITYRNDDARLIDFTGYLADQG